MNNQLFRRCQAHRESWRSLKFCAGVARRASPHYVCAMAATLIQPGAVLTPGYLDRNAQKDLLAAIEAVLRAASLYTPRMPKSGQPMSVRMSNCGPLGWVTDA